MEWNPEVVRRVRGAMQDRARSQACLFKAFSSVMTREQAEALAREGIAEYGRIRAERDGRKLAPEDWMNEHYTMMGGVFETEISDTEEYCEMKMHYCPLLEEWKKMGLSPEDQDLSVTWLWNWIATAPRSTASRAISWNASARATPSAASCCGKRRRIDRDGGLFRLIARLPGKRRAYAPAFRGAGPQQHKGIP